MFDGIFWNPPKKYKFKFDRPKRFGAPKIYETHIGMAGVEPAIHTFQEFI